MKTVYTAFGITVLYGRSQSKNMTPLCVYGADFLQDIYLFLLHSQSYSSLHKNRKKLLNHKNTGLFARYFS